MADRQIGRQVDGTGRQEDKTYRHVDRQAGTLADRQTGRQADWQTGRQVDRQTGRWTRGKAGRQIGELPKAQGQSGQEPKEPYWVIPINKTGG